MTRGMAPVVAATTERPSGRIGALAKAVVHETNQARRREGRGTLKASRKLNAAARRRARKQAGQGFMSHTGWASVIKAVGLDPSDGAGENLSENYASAPGVVRAWLNSPGHRRNLLDPEYAWIGVGASRNRRTGTVYIAQLFLEAN